MKIEQRVLGKDCQWTLQWKTHQWQENSQLVLVFGDIQILSKATCYADLKKIYPSSNIIFVSDSGSILDTNVYEQTLVSTALFFKQSTISIVSEIFTETSNAYEIGKKLWWSIDTHGLKHVMIFCEWLWINGSDVVRWVRENLPSNITLSWGLAGDSMKHEKTFVTLNDSPSGEHIILIGFYGDTLQISCSTVWISETFWIKRMITKSRWNILYEIDGEPALDLYKRYLWDEAINLPWNWFYFPLQITSPDKKVQLVRILLGIDESTKSVSFGGDIPQWYEACFLRTCVESLIDWAGNAAKNILQSLPEADISLLISCVGRKAVLKQRVEEELENIRFILGQKPVLAGFYSYGEIAPSSDKQWCFLHNLTMTITSFKEGV